MGLLCALRAELDRNGEVVEASLLGDGITTGDTRKVDESRLDNASLALVSLEELLGEAEASVGQERVADPAPSLALTTSSPPN